ncbi:MAG: hypothetical protein ABIQ51_26870 [Mesorhizobium sp.]
MVQVEGLSVTGLPVKIVLKFSPLAEVTAATAAMDGGMLGSIGGDIHLNRPARLAIEFVVEPLGIDPLAVKYS